MLKFKSAGCLTVLQLVFSENGKWVFNKLMNNKYQHLLFWLSCRASDVCAALELGEFSEAFSRANSASDNLRFRLKNFACMEKSHTMQRK